MFAWIESSVPQMTKRSPGVAAVVKGRFDKNMEKVCQDMAYPIYLRAFSMFQKYISRTQDFVLDILDICDILSIGTFSFGG